MKKVQLIPVHQHDTLFFACVLDARPVATVMHRSKEDEILDSQRPWSKSKVSEIADYVNRHMKFSGETKSVKGLLPNAPIISLKSPFQIQHTGNGDYFVLFPDDKSEFANFADAIEVIDGQHRLLAFASDLKNPSFSDDIPYEMIFSVFAPMDREDKQELFMITNEKQTKVEPNLLRLLKKQLNLLGDDEKVFDFVSRLNAADYSPLRGRIMIGSADITKGYKEGQLSKILDKSGSFGKLEAFTGNDQGKMCRGISLYLNAWETVYDVSYQQPGKSALTKISGLRYILYLFPDMLHLLELQNELATKDAFISLIKRLATATGVENVFTNPDTSLAFRGEGATVKLAREHSKQLVAHINASKSTTNPAAAW